MKSRYLFGWKCAIRIAATGFRPTLPGHRKAIERLPQEGCIAIGEGRPVFFIILDINQSKSIHGTCRPCGGDAALNMIAASLRNAAREQSLRCRIGGEEFLVVSAYANARGWISICKGVAPRRPAATARSQGKQSLDLAAI